VNNPGYCVRCNRYTRSKQLYAVLVSGRKEFVQETLGRIKEICGRRDAKGLIGLVMTLRKDQKDSNTATRITVDERVCPECDGVAIVGRMYRRDEKKKWAELSALAFGFTDRAAEADGRDPARA